MPGTAQARLLVRNNQLEQINHGVLITGMTTELFTLLHKQQVSEEEFLAAYLAVAKYGHERAALLMAQFIEAYRAAQAPGEEHAAPLLAEWDAGAAYGRCSSALDELHTLRVDQISPAEVERRFWEIAERYAVTEHRHALNAGRDTMEFSCAANDTRWRRVTDGNPCAFCAMLATRSDYRTRESAMRVVGRANGYGTAEYKATGKLTYGGQISRGKRKGQDRRRGSRPIGSSYHDSCGCTVAEVIGDWEMSDREREYADLYNRAVQKCQDDGVQATPANVTTAMRELGVGVVHDAAKPEPQAGGAGRGGSGEGATAAPVGGFNEREQKLVRYLRNRGHSVTRNVYPNANGRVADSDVDGERAEFKGFDTKDPTSNTIRNAVNDSKRRGGQAPFLIFDARGTSLTEDEARRGIRRGLGLASVVVHIRVVGDDYDIEEVRRG